jgi:hypothetical protein
MNIRAIVSTHLAGIADAITKDIVAALGAALVGAQTAGVSKAPKAARAKKAPKAAPKAARTSRVKSATTHEANAVAIATYVADHPEGVGAEAIRSGTGISKPAWTKAAKAAIAGGVVRTEGQKRTMKYFPVVGEGVEDAAQPPSIEAGAVIRSQSVDE